MPPFHPPAGVLPPEEPAAEPAGRAFGWPWLGLAGAIALHVADEAAHDFLAVYNPNVVAIRARLPWLPLPTFTFAEWLASLASGVALLLLLSPYAFRGARWLRAVAVVLGALMIANGLAHVGSSLYLHRLMPGAWSSPVLLAVSVWLILACLREDRNTSET